MAKTKQIVLQSFVPWTVEVNFRNDKGEPVTAANGVIKTVRIPSKDNAPKNILILSPDDFEGVRADVQKYLDLGQRGGVVLIDDIPSGFWDPAQRVAEAEAKRDAAVTEVMAANKKVSDLETEIVRLNDILTRTYGWKEK